MEFSVFFLSLSFIDFCLRSGFGAKTSSNQLQLVLVLRNLILNVSNRHIPNTYSFRWLFFPPNRFTLEEINGSGAIIIVGAYKQTRIELDDHFTEIFAIRLCQCLEIVMIDHKINWNLSRWNEIYYENHENRRTNNIFNV